MSTPRDSQRPPTSGDAAPSESATGAAKGGDGFAGRKRSKGGRESADRTERAREEVARLFGFELGAPRFEQALTHPSFAHENRDVADNQRLEFLGDAVLDFCASEILFERFAGADEGTLTRTRAQLVNSEALAEFAREKSISSALRLGRGAQTAGLGGSTNVLADAVEALIAATYLEHGLDAARAVCLGVVDFGLERAPDAGGRDAKSELQERVQALGQRPPVYRVVESGGPSHDTWFEVEVSVGERRVGRGRGRSKRAAERAAAAEALLEKGYETAISEDES
jgi:ribonuclease-3